MKGGRGVVGLAGRTGQLLVAPRAAVQRIDAQGGGLRDTLWLIVIAAVTFRFPRFLEAVLGLADPSLAGLGRLVAVVIPELQQAAWVVIPAALIITVAAGKRRDPSQDLELGAACYAPYFLVRGLLWIAGAALGGRALPELALQIAPAAAALVVLVVAVQVARGRQAAPETPPPAAEAPAVPPSGRRALAAGAGTLLVAAVALAINAVWSAGHLEALRPMRAGEAAPAVVLPRIDGGPAFSLAERRGHVVVLDFWATWCPPCLAMMPVLHRLHEEWAGQGVEFIGVDSDGGDITAAQLQAFAREHQIPYPIVMDDGTANSLYKVRALPQLVIIGRDGAVLRTFLGFTGHDAIARALRDAVGAR